MADWDDSPQLVLLFPIPALTRHSTCAHKRKIMRGSRLCCAICHQSGLDHLAALKRSPATDPKPEPKVEPKPKKLTRKQKRAKAAAEKAKQVRPCAG